MPEKKVDEKKEGGANREEVFRFGIQTNCPCNIKRQLEAAAEAFLVLLRERGNALIIEGGLVEIHFSTKKKKK